jgi:cold shock CspA family protein
MTTLRQQTGGSTGKDDTFIVQPPVESAQPKPAEPPAREKVPEPVRAAPAPPKPTGKLGQGETEGEITKIVDRPVESGGWFGFIHTQGGDVYFNRGSLADGITREELQQGIRVGFIKPPAPPGGQKPSARNLHPI